MHPGCNLQGFVQPYIRSLFITGSQFCSTKIDLSSEKTLQSWTLQAGPTLILRKLSSYLSPEVVRSLATFGFLYTLFFGLVGLQISCTKTQTFPILRHLTNSVYHPLTCTVLLPAIIHCSHLRRTAMSPAMPPKKRNLGSRTSTGQSSLWKGLQCAQL